MKHLKAALLFSMVTCSMTLAHAVSLKQISVVLNNSQVRSMMGSFDVISITDTSPVGVKCPCYTVTIELKNRDLASKTNRRAIRVDLGREEITSIEDVTYQPQR